MCELAISAEGTHVEELGWDGDVVDEVTMDESALVKEFNLG